MKSKTNKILLIISLAVIIVLCSFLRHCSHPEKPDNSKQDSIKTSLYIQALEDELQAHKLRLLAQAQKDTVTKWRTRWREIKADSVPCDQKTAIADTVIIHDSVLIETESDVIQKQELALNDWHLIHSIDSAQLVRAHETLTDTVKYYTKRCRRRYWRGFIDGFIVGNGTGAAASSTLRSK